MPSDFFAVVDYISQQTSILRYQFNLKVRRFGFERAFKLKGISTEVGTVVCELRLFV